LFLPAVAVAEDAWITDPAHYKLELENDSVVIVRVSYGPRERSNGQIDVPDNRVAVSLTPFHARVTYEDGRVIEFRQDMGAVFPGRKGRITVENLADQAFELITVLVKGGGQTPGVAALDSLLVDPGHHGLVLDNDLYRVIRVRFGPKEVARGAFEGGGAIVRLTPVQAEVTRIADGASFKRNMPAGSVGWNPPGVVLPRNLADMALEFVVVQPKR
jgi:hypothetical protein